MIRSYKVDGNSSMVYAHRYITDASAKMVRSEFILERFKSDTVNLCPRVKLTAFGTHLMFYIHTKYLVLEVKGNQRVVKG